MTSVDHMPFGPVTIAFDRRVLRPRPWTLAQAEWAAELSSGLQAGPILELAAGAGHIGLAASVLTGRRLVQVDISPVACTWARVNARAAGRSRATEVRCGSFAVVLDGDERFPLVIADPPYIPTADIDTFPDDPRVAIDGGPDGLDLVRQCVAVAAAHVMPGGAVLLQTRGAGQAEATLGGDTALVLTEVRSWGPHRAVALARPLDRPAAGRGGVTASAADGPPASARNTGGCATMHP